MTCQFVHKSVDQVLFEKECKAALKEAIENGHIGVQYLIEQLPKEDHHILMFELELAFAVGFKAGRRWEGPIPSPG